MWSAEDVIEYVIQPTSFKFSFEKNVNVFDYVEWISTFWHHCFYYAAAYLLLVFFGPKLMENYKGFELRVPLTLWNVGLAVFCFIASWRTLPELFHTMYYQGFLACLCDSSFYTPDKVSGFWSVAFVFSKIFELGDTVFVVLRKRKVPFLQWYHHMVSLLYVWYLFRHSSSNARLLMELNYVVHVVIYTYLAAKCMKYNPPRAVAIFILILELMQMVIGIGVNLWSYFLIRDGVSCDIPPFTIKWSLTVYLSLFVVVGYFMYTSLFTKKGSKNKTE